MLAALALLSAHTAFVAPITSRVQPARAMVTMETKEDLVKIAEQCNPAVKFFDPLGITESTILGTTEETIGFFREAEIKHGRVAMAAFVGYIAHANAVRFPWPQWFGEDVSAINAITNPPELWDAIPIAARYQIIGLIGFLEFWREVAGTHYMRGGKPGEFPSFKSAKVPLPHPVPLDLFDPLGFSKNKSKEAKEKGLIKEINNGRLAMIGIAGFMSEAYIPGSVPALSSIVKPYAGNIMAPFA